MNKNDQRWHTNPALWEKLRPLAREKRHKPTEVENTLWKLLRRHNLCGYKFRRQHSIEGFIVDFYCAKARLVIEIDGLIHLKQVEEDSIRQEFLENKNLKFLRFTNDTVLNNPDEVIKTILTCLPHPY